MKCMKCDTSIEPGERFCIGCGAPVQAAASPAESFCTECGSKLDPGARFCDECGTATEAAVPAEAKSVTSAVPVDSPDIRSPAEFVQKPAAAPVSDFDGTEKTAPPTETADAASTDAPSDGSNEKASSVGTLLGLIVVVAVAGAVAIAVSLQSTKSSAPDGKPSQAANSSQPPAVASQGKAPADKAAGAATNVSGRLLIDAASSGNAEKFQAIFQQLQLAEKPEPGDRAIARKLNEAALMALRRKSYDQAVDALQKAMAADPTDIEVADNLGYALQMAGQFKAAETQLIAVIEKAPDRASAWLNLAEASSRLGKSNQAVAAYLTAYKFSRSPERLLEALKKMTDTAEDETSRKNIRDAIQKIESAK